MKQIRKTYLQNSAGERFPLNGEQGVFFAEISGLGVMLSPSFGDLGYGFFTVSDEKAEPQNAVAGTLYFAPDAYSNFQRFVDWVFSAGQLIFVYKPYPDSELIRRISVNYINKGELNEVGWLICPVSFLPISPWARRDPVELTFGSSDSDGVPLEYDFYYEDDLRYGADSAATMSGTIAGSGHTPASILLRFYGAISNPVIRLMGNVSGETHGLCSIQAELGASDVLELSTLYTDSHVWKIAPNGVKTDLINDVDPSTNHYFHVPVNEPCTISLEASGLFNGEVELLVYYYYKTR